MKNLIYQKTETDSEIIYTFKNLWAIYVILIIGALLVLESSYRYVGGGLLAFTFLCLMPIRNIISKAMKDGCQVKGSKWSIKNPLEIRIKK
ncbi:MAG: hypothetical protein ISS47_02620 [Candidatus Omnitrophica bacterium]|nr:hypothetical protein [Candidatus Omnitrophota bacterium]